MRTAIVIGGWLHGFNLPVPLGTLTVNIESIQRAPYGWRRINRDVYDVSLMHRPEEEGTGVPPTLTLVHRTIPPHTAVEMFDRLCGDE